METALSSDQALFAATTRKFLAAETPVGSGRAREHDDFPFDRTWWKQGADLGWTSLLIPEALGGGSISGQGVLDLVLVAEETGRVVAPGPLLPVNVVAAALAQAEPGGHGDVLSSIMTGEAIATWALHEPGGSWNSDGVALRAEPGAGGLILTGTKTLVEAANQADQLLVVARTDQGIVELLVPTSSPGLSISTSPTLDLSRRYCTIGFAGVEVPAAAIVGPAGDTAAAVEWQLQLAGALQVAELVGVAASVVEFTLTYLDDRTSFGRQLSSYQALKHRVADLKMWLEACAGVASEAARAVQHRDPAASTVVSAAKAYVGERTTEIVQDCIQLHGGIGVTWEHDLHLFLRRAMVDRFTYGTPEDHRQRIARSAGLA